MAEVSEESTHVWSHKARIALFLSAMRHFRDELNKQRFKVNYRSLEENDNQGTLAQELKSSIEELDPDRLVLTHPGDYRVLQSIKAVADEKKVDLEIRPDEHFLCSLDEFEEFVEGRKEIRLEHFYRKMRRRHNYLMDGKDPAGGKWNYDKQNRKTFGKKGPGQIPAPIELKQDRITTGVIKLVNERFEDHPGSLDSLNWSVTREQALEALCDFVENRLPQFGDYQDAMWTDEPFLFHSRLASALNLKLLSPKEVMDAAEQAYEDEKAPLAAVEGFIRQILGWREYVRGIYWTFMPEYAERNTFQATRSLPDFYWTGETDMTCLKQAIGQTLEHGYAHHIQRLMITGLFALLAGISPKEVHEWYLAVYVDAVEWVELPNTLGMSQAADDGTMASKPYVASGKYINRMSNYCSECPFNPEKSHGEDACPFTTLYWHFLLQHEEQLSGNTRMNLQIKSLDKLDQSDRDAIESQAKTILARFED